MRNEGIEKQKIFELLEKKLKKDLSYESGSILGSMCSEPLNIAKEIHEKYISKNLGDPGLFLGTAELEKEVIREIGGLFGNSNVIGTFTTGGSEANLIAMRIARNLRPNIKKPEVVLPCSAHVSFDKAADLLNLKLKKVNLHDNFQLDLNHLESLVNDKTCAVVGVAGTTSLGLVDPIEKIGEIIEGRDIFFHVDAAFGGFVLPFLKELGYSVPAWDFSLKSVDSITADAHKMGLGIIPSGGFFVKDASILNKTGFEIPYLAGGNFRHFHIVGTRPGSPIIAFWAIVNHLGVKGFTEIVKKCMENTKFLAQRISEIDGVKLAADPIMNVIGITTESGDSICELEKSLRNNKWMLGKFLDFNLVRTVIMPHVKREHLLEFSYDLEKIVQKLKL
ncbi:MAG: tyrosine decarboxylase MfnA [Promethearchaeota archaeon]